jgi:hypothetical protein
LNQLKYSKNSPQFYRNLRKNIETFRQEIDYELHNNFNKLLKAWKEVRANRITYVLIDNLIKTSTCDEFTENNSVCYSLEKISELLFSKSTRIDWTITKEI